MDGHHHHHSNRNSGHAPPVGSQTVVSQRLCIRFKSPKIYLQRRNTGCFYMTYMQYIALPSRWRTCARNVCNGL
uniref:Uncharacterized protein n=1 Tax=Anguilla anguilla TaxID=7936 RepID=A0A0E9X103_ANGAN